MKDNYAVVRVAGSDPELFIIAFINLSELPQKEFMKTTHPAPEIEIRAELKKMGCTQIEINSLLQQARENPR